MIVAIAKNDYKYEEYPYVNWIKNHTYKCQEDDHLLEIENEQGNTIYFSVEAKNNLGDIFEFRFNK